ncbi:acetyl-CoA sensor PanZ family protein [Thalassolituus sp.]|uniref:acetyl-CoA sensor PanZ family protein n=1 Tax=Thalassolituus sp. TaxID=2030822 RepID=UPI002A80AC92|nr:acetyl-CoA sensor PanZ family protein [Thalassolituus sp.]
MPVKLEHLTTPTDADWNDLSKIHQDTAVSGLTLSEIDMKDWLTVDRWIVAGRFNDRVVGAFLVERNQNEVRLSQAGVRSITQRRGVMHQMIHFIQRWADQNTLTLIIGLADTNMNDALKEALIKRGFASKDDALTYNAD